MTIIQAKGLKRGTVVTNTTCQFKGEVMEVGRYGCTIQWYGINRDWYFPFTNMHSIHIMAN